MEELSIDEKKDIDLKAILEGLLYVVGEEGLSTEQILAVLEIDENECLRYLDEIKAKYEDIHTGIELAFYGNKYKLVSKEFVLPYAQKLFHNYKIETISPAALETLAIVAYKQPVTRAEIEELRGVGCEVILRRLLTRGYLKEAGRSTAPGRPILYEVTDELLDSFGLSSLAELPELPVYQENTTLFDDQDI